LFACVFETDSLLFFDNAGTKLAAVVDNKILLIDTRQESLSMLGIEEVRAVAIYKGDIFVFKSPDILLKIDETDEEPTILGNLRFVPKELMVSPDGNKLLFFHNFTVGVVWLEEVLEEPVKTLGQQDIVYQPINPTKNLSWHSSSEYIMALLENGDFIVTELDIRDKQNVWTWNFKDISSFDYLEKEKSLFVQKKDGTLLRHLDDF